MGARKIVQTSPEYEARFRAEFQLREDVADDPIWQDAYEHAATHLLYPDEINAVGSVLVRRTTPEAEEKPEPIGNCPKCGVAAYTDEGYCGVCRG
ncbi:MAG: hypothetical protein GY820_00050 [Gammaproteobacteria bacterium]|nr:hypothetical protein [Gammaproteobacteria bacterium]